MKTRHTLAESVELTPPKIKGSRFTAWLGRADDRATADRLVAARRALDPQASHHCWAWRGLGPTDLAFSDDGEPNGSAGRPILDVITGQDLTGVVAVVTRWFGGTKLGVGGLVRAYGGAVVAALDTAEIVEIVPTETLVAQFGYGDSGPVKGVLVAQGVEPDDEVFGADVTQTFALPLAEAEALAIALRDATAGRAIIRWPDRVLPG